MMKLMMLKEIQEFVFEGDVKQKTLIKYPSISLGIVVAYIIFVKWLGPMIMNNRKPFDLKYTMIVYDFGQSVVNAYLTYTIYSFIAETWEGRCMVKYSPLVPLFMERILRVGWQVYLVKYADLVDTIFFVLRKKDSQISFLHVFHHSLMCVLCCWGLKYIDSYALGFHIGFGLAINTSVHVIVYLYYGVAAFGPHMNKYLWWKKYLTLFQMVQFVAILGYLSHGFMTGCEELGVVEISVFLYIVAIFILFINFYKKYKND